MVVVMCRLARRLRCAVSAHRWQSTPMTGGSVVVACQRCREAVSAGFTDVERVRSTPPTWLGPLPVALSVLDAVSAVLAGDGAGYARARADAVTRPGASVDAMTVLAAVLARSQRAPDPLATVRALAVLAEAGAAVVEGTGDG